LGGRSCVGGPRACGSTARNAASPQMQLASIGRPTFHCGLASSRSRVRCRARRCQATSHPACSTPCSTSISGIKAKRQEHEKQQRLVRPETVAGSHSRLKASAYDRSQFSSAARRGYLRCFLDVLRGPARHSSLAIAQRMKSLECYEHAHRSLDNGRVKRRLDRDCCCRGDVRRQPSAVNSNSGADKVSLCAKDTRTHGLQRARRPPTTTWGYSLTSMRSRLS
jgi:hypothetical protein